MSHSLLLPMFVLMAWTFVMFVWMYATRIPMMQKLGKHPDTYKHPSSLAKEELPSQVRQVADNYNHLLEQPTIFYALVIGIILAGTATQIDLYLVWAYVVFRIFHSIWQAAVNAVMIRFYLFLVSSLMLLILIVRALSALL